MNFLMDEKGWSVPTHVSISHESVRKFLPLESPKICSGLTNLRLLKTTQSAFRDFFQDGYRTLPDANDRIFSTVVTATWEFSTANGVDFDSAWNAVKDSVIDCFAGPPDTGIFSPSVQNTLYLAEKMALDKVPQVGWFSQVVSFWGIGVSDKENRDANAE